jgi:large subunit ribosomal protein L25
MSDRPRLAAASRTVTGKAVASIRREGRIPAVVYGHGTASEPVSIDAHEFEQLRRHTGGSTLIDLTVDSTKSRPVLVHGVQVHPVNRRPLHVDLFVVRMTEELTVEVSINFVGESLAVERLGGVLLHLRESVQVRALPDHLPQSVEIDISSLDNFEQLLHVSDILIPSDVTLVTDAGEPVARVQAPRIEEVEVVAEAEEGEAAGEGVEPTAEAEESSE